MSHPATPHATTRKRRVWPWIGAAVLALLLLVAVIGATARPGPDPVGATSTPVPPSYTLGDGSVDSTRRVTSPVSNVPVQATQNAAPAPKPGPLTTVSDGTYEVGVDMVAGRYKTPGPATRDVLDSCYWARNKDDSGESIITNSLVRGPGSVTVKKGEFLELSGGCTWTKQ